MTVLLGVAIGIGCAWLIGLTALTVNGAVYGFNSYPGEWTGLLYFLYPLGAIVGAIEGWRRA